MRDLFQDLRYSFRSLARTPGFAILAILTLALGIGANSAIFSVINGVILKPLGYPNPDQLVMVTSQFPGLGFDKFWVSPPEYFELRERARSFSEIGAYRATAVNLSEGEIPERVNAVNLTATLFKALGVPALRGRVFTDQEDLPNSEPVAIVGYELWQRAFGGDPALIGKQIDVDGRKTLVLGIMPPGFDIHDSRGELWLPMGLDPANRQNRGSHFLYLVGRTKPGVGLRQANAELNTLLAQWGEVTPNTHVPHPVNHRLQYATLQSDVVGNIARALWVLQVAVGFVLLIACANMANLLLARAESRHREFAIRTALGAGRSRLLRQFLTEGVGLAMLGGIVGLGLAYAGLEALIAANPDSLPRSAEIGLDVPVVVFTIFVALLTGVVFGLAPLLHVGQRAVSLALKEGGTRSTATIARNRVRRGLVVAEVALAVMLVIGAGLMLRSFWKLMQFDSGFDRANLATFGLVLPAAKYQEQPRRVAFFNDLTTRLRSVPGIQSAAAMSGLPPFRQVNANDTQFENYQHVEGGPPANVDYYQSSTVDYTAAMKIPVLEGRTFGPQDGATSTPVVLVNETLAKMYWPNESAVGHRLRVCCGDRIPWATIVGVVKDVKQGGIDQKTGTEIYFLYDQMIALFGGAPRNMNVVVRSTLPLESLTRVIREQVSAMDRTLPIVDLRMMDDVFADSVARQRFLAQLLGIFAALALALAAVGTYGVLSYLVTERQREIGIRMALGANRTNVLSLVLRQGLSTTVIGLVLGIGGAMGLTRLATSLLFEVKPTDPLTFGAVAGVITLVALVACVVPARRATKVDPIVALREE
ncbi:MAG TPA: ABC transporter permease [Gemmatimonadaceae bacterium]|nr:ABC transporter permease [Gemmatimonadaceae bacterium]